VGKSIVGRVIRPIWGKKRDEYRVLIGKYERKRPLDKRRLGKTTLR
jgi:hypothetical protein